MKLGEKLAAAGEGGYENGCEQRLAWL